MPQVLAPRIRLIHERGPGSAAAGVRLSIMSTAGDLAFALVMAHYGGSPAAGMTFIARAAALATRARTFRHISTSAVFPGSEPPGQVRLESSLSVP